MHFQYCFLVERDFSICMRSDVMPFSAGAVRYGPRVYECLDVCQHRFASATTRFSTILISHTVSGGVKRNCVNVDTKFVLYDILHSIDYAKHSEMAVYGCY